MDEQEKQKVLTMNGQVLAFRKEKSQEADAYPLGAHYKVLTEEEKKTMSRNARVRRYRVSANLSWSELCHLERIVYEYSNSFNRFITAISSGNIVLARREDVMRVFKEEHDFAKGLDDECWDEDPNQA